MQPGEIVSPDDSDAALPADGPIIGKNQSLEVPINSLDVVEAPFNVITAHAGIR